MSVFGTKLKIRNSGVQIGTLTAQARYSEACQINMSLFCKINARLLFISVDWS
jgi:hypothetical protein